MVVWSRTLRARRRLPLKRLGLSLGLAREDRHSSGRRACAFVGVLILLISKSRLQ
jgi:hypothetical protein